MFVIPCAIIALLSLYLSFLCFGLLVRTRSRPYGLCHRPYTMAYIKGFGSPYFHVYACLLLCFMFALASLVLGFAMFGTLHGLDHVCLHLTPMRPRLGVITWDASPDAGLLCMNLSPFSLRAAICLPCMFVPLIGFICIFTCLLICPCMSLVC